MSEKREPQVRAEEPELADETLEEVAGGFCLTLTCITMDASCFEVPDAAP